MFSDSPHLLSLLLDQYGLADSAPSLADRHGLSLAHVAAYVRSPPCLALLRALPSFPSAPKDKAGRTPLHLALSRNACSRDPLPPPDAGDRDSLSPTVELLLDWDNSSSSLNAKDNAGVSPLMLAAAVLHGANCVELLLRAGADVQAVDNHGRNVFFYASRGGYPTYTALVHHLQADHTHGKHLLHSLLNATDVYGSTPAHAAASAGATDILLDLLDVHGVDVNASGSHGRSLLYTAVASSAPLPLIQALLSRGAHTHHDLPVQHDTDHLAQHEEQHTHHHQPIFAAITAENSEVLELLISASPAPPETIVDANARTGAHYAGAAGYLPFFNSALMGECLGSLVNSVDKAGHSVAHIAAIQGNVDILQSIVPLGGDLSLLSLAGLSPLHLAALNKRVDVVQFLLHAGVRPETRSSRSSGLTTALHLASLMDAQDVVDLLVEADSDLVTLRDGKGRLPLHMATIGGAQELLDRLTPDLDTLQAPDEVGLTPLALSVLYGHEGLAEEILDRTGDATGTDLYGRTLLHYAARNQDRDMARALLSVDDACEALLAPDASGWSALTESALAGDYRTLRIMLGDLADLESGQEDPLPSWLKHKEVSTGVTLLHVAAFAGHIEVLELLGDEIDASVWSTTVDARGRTPVHYAVLRLDMDLPPHPAARLGPLGGDFSDDDDDDSDGSSSDNGTSYTQSGPQDPVLAFLESLDVDLDVPDATGESPLHLASRMGSKTAINTLIDLGASTSSLDARGLSPLAAAVVARSVEGVSALLMSGVPPLTRNLAGETPLHLAVGTRNVWLLSEVLDDLDDSSVDDESRDDDDEEEEEDDDDDDDREEGGRALVHITSPLDYEDVYGSTALHVAVSLGFVEGIESLVAAGARLNMVDCAGRTPLMAALEYRSMFDQDGSHFVDLLQTLGLNDLVGIEGVEEDLASARSILARAAVQRDGNVLLAVYRALDTPSHLLFQESSGVLSPLILACLYRNHDVLNVLLPLLPPSSRLTVNSNAGKRLIWAASVGDVPGLLPHLDLEDADTIAHLADLSTTFSSQAIISSLPSDADATDDIVGVSVGDGVGGGSGTGKDDAGTTSWSFWVGAVVVAVAAVGVALWARKTSM